MSSGVRNDIIIIYIGRPPVVRTRRACGDAQLPGVPHSANGEIVRRLICGDSLSADDGQDIWFISRTRRKSI